MECHRNTGWRERSDRLELRILRDVTPTGIDRKAYYAVWKVVGYWLSHGLTYADITRTPEADAVHRPLLAVW